MKTVNEEEAEIELKRAPGTCCPEPSCDYVDFKFDVCKGCGAKCSECIHNKQKKNENSMEQKIMLFQHDLKCLTSGLLHTEDEWLLYNYLCNWYRTNTEK